MKQWMKRLVSTGLALVLLAGFAFAYPSGVGYDDVEQDDYYSQAVYGLLSELGIMEGYGDGTFGPENEVSRAEMAKILFVISTGGKSDPAEYAALETPFTDIGGHWAEQYIKYGYANNLFNGMSATTFEPNSKLTGYQCAKMLQSLLGYTFDYNGQSGYTWKDYVEDHLLIFTESGANYDPSQLTGLTNDNKGQFNFSPLDANWTRGDVADMVYRTLHKNTRSVASDGNSGFLFVPGRYLLAAKFELTYYSGTIIATDELNLYPDLDKDTDNVFQAKENEFRMSTHNESGLITVATEDGLDYTWLGRSVDVYLTGSRDLQYIFFNDSLGHLMTGKVLVTVDGQTVTAVNPSGQHYEHSFTDAEWKTEIPFIHGFGEAKDTKISDLFTKKNYLYGASSDRVILGYDENNMLVFALSFTNTLDKISKLDEEGDRVQIRSKWYDIGDLDGAEVGDYVLYSISGIDGKIYMAKTEVVTLTDLRYDSSDKTVYHTNDEGEEVAVVFANGVTDPGSKLISSGSYRSFASKGEQTVYVINDIVYGIVK